MIRVVNKVLTIYHCIIKYLFLCHIPARGVCISLSDILYRVFYNRADSILVHNNDTVSMFCICLHRVPIVGNLIGKLVKSIRFVEHIKLNLRKSIQFDNLTRL